VSFAVHYHWVTRDFVFTFRRIVPILFSFLCLANVATVCALLKAVTECDTNLEVIRKFVGFYSRYCLSDSCMYSTVEVIHYMEDRELLINQLRDRIRAKIEGLDVGKHQVRCHILNTSFCMLRQLFPLTDYTTNIR
jgi:hypothetical protein